MYYLVLFSKEGSEVRLDGEAGEGIEGVEEEIHKRTNVSSIRSRQKNKDGSRFMWLYNKRSIIYSVRMKNRNP